MVVLCLFEIAAAVSREGYSLLWVLVSLITVGQVPAPEGLQ